MSGVAKKAKVRVRCLGPGREHTFLSPDPRHVRVCDACQKKRPVSASYYPTARDR